MGLCDSKLPADKIKKGEKKGSEKLDEPLH